MDTNNPVSVKPKQKERSKMQLSVNGRIVFWSLGNDSEHKALKEGFEQLGLSAFTPDEQSAVMSLKAALTEVYGSRRCLVRKLEKPKVPGFQITQERASGENNAGLEYHKLFSVEIPTGPCGIVFMDPDTGVRIPAPKYADVVRDLFWKELDKVPRDNLARSLKRIVAQKANGITLKETGGVYWIPEKNLALWDQVVSVTQAASPGGRNKIYGPRTLLDDDLVHMAMDWLAQNVESEMGQIRERLGKAKTKRGKSTQENAASDLHDKVRAYEGIFSKTLQGLRDSTEDLNAARVMTALGKLGKLTA